MDEAGVSNASGGEPEHSNANVNPVPVTVPDEPTFAEKMLSTLRTHIESGQAMMGAQGRHSNNAIVNPMRNAANATEIPTIEATIDSADKSHPGLVGAASGATVVSASVPMSPRSAHAMAATAHAEARRKRRALEDARHKKERDDKLSRYLALIICIVVIILSLLGMAAISRRVIGKWWHGAPEPIPEPAVSHSPLIFPGFSSK
jgi:hypothetical protein